MTLRTLAALAALLGLLVAAPNAQLSVIPIDEVRPGMVGVGRTVFEGDAIEEFKVHILGTLKNVVGPRRARSRCTSSSPVQTNVWSFSPPR